MMYKILIICIMVTMIFAVVQCGGGYGNDNDKAGTLSVPIFGAEDSSIVP